MNRFVSGTIAILSLVFILVLLYKLQPMSFGNQSVSRVKVIQGHEYDVFLENGSRLHVFLSVVTPPEAKIEVVRFLNDCEECYLVSRGYYVDLMVLTESEYVSLTNWLRNNNLAWDKELNNG
jgi:hypothetical protein